MMPRRLLSAKLERPNRDVDRGRDKSVDYWRRGYSYKPADTTRNAGIICKRGLQDHVDINCLQSWSVILQQKREGGQDCESLKNRI